MTQSRGPRVPSSPLGKLQCLCLGGSSETPLENSEHGHRQSRVMSELKLAKEMAPLSPPGWRLRRLRGCGRAAEAAARPGVGAYRGHRRSRRPSRQCRPLLDQGGWRAGAQQVMGGESGATDQPQRKISCDGCRVPRAMGIAVSGTRDHHPPWGVWATAQRPQKSMRHSVKTAVLTRTVVCLLQEVKSGKNNKNRDCKASCVQN